MALPLLMLAAGLGGREYQDAERTRSAADAFRGALGDAPARFENFPGEPDTVQPGSGLRGAVAADPALTGMLQLLERMAGQPGVAPQQLLSLAGSLASLQHGTQLQNRTFEEERNRMFSGQSFQERQQERQIDNAWLMRADDQDFRTWELQQHERIQEAQQRRQFGHAWGLAKFHEQVADARAALKAQQDGLIAPTRPYYIPSAQGIRQVVGPSPGTGEYAKVVQEVGDWRQAANTVDELLDSYRSNSEQGREWSGMTGGQQTQLYDRVQGMVFKLRGMGAPQEKELENFEKRYPSPQEFFKALQSDDRLFAVFEKLREEVANKHQLQLDAHPWIATQGRLGAPLGPMPTARSVSDRELRVAPADVAKRLTPYNARQQRGW